MRRIVAQARKDLTQLVRDRLALALALVLPVCLTALLGTSISLTVTDIALVIQDLDQTPLSRQYADAFRSSLTFRIVALPARRLAGERAVHGAGAGRPHHPAALRPGDPPGRGRRGPDPRGRHRHEHRAARPGQRRPDHPRLRPRSSARRRRRPGSGRPRACGSIPGASRGSSTDRGCSSSPCRSSRPCSPRSPCRARGSSEPSSRSTRRASRPTSSCSERSSPARSSAWRPGSCCMGLMFTLFGLRLAGDPTPLARGQRAVRLLRRELRHARRRRLAQSGRGRPGGAASADSSSPFSSPGSSSPSRTFPPALRLDLLPGPGALLHRRRARRIPAGRRLARRLGVGADDRRHRARLLRRSRGGRCAACR